jgi:putative hydrolase of HD superfamily
VARGCTGPGIGRRAPRAAQLAALIAAEDGADPTRAAFLALWHDNQETRTGDLPHTATAYLTTPDPRQIIADQTENLPGRSRTLIREDLHLETSRRIAEAAITLSPLSWRDR